MQADLAILASQNLQAQNRRRFIWALLASIALHLLLLPLVPRLSTPLNGIRPSLEEQSIMLENIAPRGQLVELPASPKDQAAPIESQYLSDVNRSTDTETQAQSTDIVQGQGGQASRSTPKPSQPSQRNRSKPAEDGAVRLNTKLPTEFLAKLGGQAPRNYLPNLQFGDSTLLNTREYVHAPFFIRMKQSLERVWNPQAALRQANRAYRDEFRTIVQMILNRDGTIYSVKVITPSSVPLLDQEAVRAIRKAAPFVNPPSELVEIDGKIHIDDFHFIVSQRYGIY